MHLSIPYLSKPRPNRLLQNTLEHKYNAQLHSFVRLPKIAFGFFLFTDFWCVKHKHKTKTEGFQIEIVTFNSNDGFKT